MSGQTLKNVRTTTVNTGMAPNFYSELTYHLGNPKMCVADPFLAHDIYGRNVGGSRVSGILYNAPECSQYVHPVSERIGFENYERPYVPVAKAGDRGFGDFKGVFTDEIPENMYGPSRAEPWKQTYYTGNNAAPMTTTPYQRQADGRPVNLGKFSMRGLEDAKIK